MIAATRRATTPWGTFPTCPKTSTLETCFTKTAQHAGRPFSLARMWLRYSDPWRSYSTSKQSMSLANPFSLLWLGLIVPVVGFYILKVRLRRVPVSTILFWRQIYDEHQPRSLWQRLRHWLSLVAQIVLILLLIAALADPFFAWETRQLRRIVLIVDNSASMNATDVSPSRLSAAKNEALRVIGGMRFRDELAVIAAGGSPRVVCGFSSHGRTLSHAVEEVAATDNPTRVTEAVELARRLLGERQEEHQGEIIVLTDVVQASSLQLKEQPDVSDPPIPNESRKSNSAELVAS